MNFIADFHIHSHYSMATSKECCPELLARWARLKGLQIIGTGDFTHPGWRKELKEKLEPAENGLYRLKAEYSGSPVHLQGSHQASDRPVRFLLSAEISSIYKKKDRVRKIHSLIIVPDLESAEKIASALDRVGNIKADGRPILGLDSRNLLEIALHFCPEVIFIPAHIWTPHFSLFGSRSGFDSLEECFEDLSGHIFALETGLSSDPAMNWRVSALDTYTLVSNSDAHSPQNLAREANCFNTDWSYAAIRHALQTKDPQKFLGTIEFYPEEGKYHFDGHRSCQVCWSPEETRAAGEICPKCGRKLTCGVLYRVTELADRPPGTRPDSAPPFESIIPLPKILADLYQTGEKSKKVQRIYLQLLSTLGSELDILRTIPLEEIRSASDALLAEGIRRVRRGEVEIHPGFDGEYGTISLFKKEDHQKFGAQISLFGLKCLPGEERKPSDRKAGRKPAESPPYQLSADQADRKDKIGEEHPARKSPEERNTPQDLDVWLLQLNAQQKACVTSPSGPVIIIAGPGTGKTRTLVCRIAYLIQSQKIAPEKILAVTFTNKAALELKSRIRGILPSGGSLEGLSVGTFHHLCLDILRNESADRERRKLIDEQDAVSLLAEVLAEKAPSLPRLRPQVVLQMFSRIKSTPWMIDHFESTFPDPEGQTSRRIREILADWPGCRQWSEKCFWDVLTAYQDRLKRYHLYDYDDLLLESVRLFRHNSSILQRYRSRFSHLLVDEFQDVNEVQYLFITLLAGNGTGLFVIGDPDQAIYTFRGADYRFFFRLQKEFPDHQLLSLEENYRSRTSIVQAASSVIAHNSDRFPLTLQSRRPEEGSIEVSLVSHEQAEGITIVREINRLMGGLDMLKAHGQGRAASLKERERGEGELGFSDFAVLFRTGQQADILEECFLHEGIPYRVVGQKGFLQAPPVRTLLAWLRFLIDPDNDFHLWNLLHSWKEISPDVLIIRNLQEFTGQNGCSPLQALRQLLQTDTIAPEHKEGPWRILSSWEKYHPGLGEHTADQLIADLASQEMMMERDEDIRRLQRCAQPFSSVTEFLDNLLLFQDGDLEYRGAKTRLKGEAVSLMTIHAAKGLEFPVVFICGLEEGLLPYDHSHGQRQHISDADSLQQTTQMEEERRLFYVALTRARDLAYLISSRKRQRYNQLMPMRPSAFLAEIPANLRRENRPSPGARSRQLRLW
ncbi:MAG: UvrD-helicase domain-containing protein [bacterium]